MNKIRSLFLRSTIRQIRLQKPGFILLAFMLFGPQLFGQTPAISSLSQHSGSTNEIITINGSGFANKTDLQVWFGAALSEISESNTTIIKAKVPAGATFGPVSVLNLSNGKSARSTLPFSPAFGGNGFSGNKMVGPTHFSANPTLNDLQLADLNGDGLSDVVTSHIAIDRISIYQNTSTGVGNVNFSKTDLIIGGYTNSIITGDLDGDGKPDLALTGQELYRDKLFFLRNTSSSGDIRFDEAVITLPVDPTGAGRLELQDLNNDGLPELIMTNVDNNKVYIFLNLSSPGDIKFSQSDIVLEHGSGNAFGLTVADMNGDNKAEIMVTPHLGKGQVYIFPNQSSEAGISFDPPHILYTLSGNINLMAGDLDNEGKPDLALTNRHNHFFGYWINQSEAEGELDFSSMSSLTTESGPYGIQLSGIDGDGFTDAVVGHVNSGTVVVMKNTSTPGGLSFTKEVISGLEKNKNVRAGDLDRDGKPEILYTSTESNKLSVLRNEICIKAKLKPGGSHQFCEGTPFRLETYQGAGLSYEWKLNGSTISGASSHYLDVAQSGNYTVTIQETELSCSSTSPEVEINVVEGSALAETEIFSIAPTITKIQTTTQAHCNNNGSIEVTEVDNSTNLTAYTFAWFDENENMLEINGVQVSGSILNTTVYPNFKARTSYHVQATRTAGACTSVLEPAKISQVTNNLSVSLASTDNTNCDIGNNANGKLTATVSIRHGNNAAVPVSGGSTYTWYKGQTTSGTIHLQGADLHEIVDQAPGWYTLELTDATTGCSITSDPVEIADNPSKVLIFQLNTQDRNLCTSNNARIWVEELIFEGSTINQSSGFTDYTFSWEDEQGNILPVNGAELNLTNYPSLSMNTPYTVKATRLIGPDGKACESNPASAKVRFNNPMLSIDFTSSTPNNSCASPNGALSAKAYYQNPGALPSGHTSRFDFTWKDKDGNIVSASFIPGSSDQQEATGLAPGIYTVTVTDNTLGCSYEAAYTLNESLPNYQITDMDIDPQDICSPSGRIQILGMNSGDISDYTFSWYRDQYGPAHQLSVNGPLLDAANYPQIGAGTYFVEAVRNGSSGNGAGCVSRLKRIEIEEDMQLPVMELVALEHVTACSPANNGSLEVTADGLLDIRNNADYQISWFVLNGGTKSPFSAVSPGNPYRLENLQAATYIAEITNLLSNCSNRSTVEILDTPNLPMIAASAADLTSCNEDNGNLYAYAYNMSGSNRHFEFHWYKGSLSSFPGTAVQPYAITQNNEALENQPTGKYTVFALEQGGMGCNSEAVETEIMDMRVLPKPKARMDAPASICDPLRPNGQASADVDGNYQRYTFRWYRGANTEESNFIAEDVIANKLAAGTYTVKATSRSTGCSDTSQVHIIEELEQIEMAETDVLATAKTSCISFNGMLSASVDGKTKGYIFYWFFGDRADDNFLINEENNPVLSELEPGTYTVYAVKNQSGCRSNPITKVVDEVLDYPEISIQTTPASCLEPNGMASITDLKGNITQVKWNINGEIIENQYQLDLPTGDYSVTVTTRQGCEISKEFSVPVDIVIYNAVTDNNDGENDFFIIDCIQHFENNLVKVFNRSGTLVFEKQGYNNVDKIFTGRGNKGVYLQGNKLPVGTYFYVVDKRNGSNPSTGYLEILR